MKVTLNGVGNLQDTTTAQTTINTNSQTIESAFDNTLSLDGTAPNEMQSVLDMNSYNIVNLPVPATANSPLRLQDLSDFTGGGTISTIPAGGTTGQALRKTSNISYDTYWGDSVTSVGLAMPADLTVTGSPVTVAGTLTAAWATTPTGLGAMVRQSSPTLVTPVLGAATGTSLLLGGVDLHPAYTNKLSVGNGSDISVMSVGQSSGSNFSVVWNYNVVPTSASVTLATASYATAININGSANNIGTLSAGTTTINNGGVGPTGTGAYVRATSPTFVTPVLGAATATSVTGPNLYGGSAAGSTLTLNGTSNGAPSSAYLLLQTNGQSVGIGTTTPLARLHVGNGVDSSALNPILYVTNAGTSAFAVRDSTADIEFGMFTSTSLGGLCAIGTRTSHPLYVQTNGSNLFAFHVSGGLSVGTTTDPGGGGVSASFVNTTGLIKSSSATAGVGYSTGAGGAVTQITSRSTGVTLNTVSGAITLFSTAGSTTPTSFTVTNSAVAATDTILVDQRTGTDLYNLHVTAVAAGSFRITAWTTGGTTVEAPILNFTVIKGVAS